jgi:hypothetical protein
MPSSLPKPEGCIIQEEEVPGGVRYFWWSKNAAGWNRFIGLAVVTAFLAGWGLAEYRTVGQFIQAWHSPASNGNAMTLAFLSIWLTGWTLGGLFMMLIGALLLLPERPESLTLIDDSFSYVPGHMTVVVKKPSPVIPLRERQLKMKRLTMSKREIEAFVFEEMDGEMNVYLKSAEGKFLVGKYLDAVDREWLYVMLEEWRSGRAG